MLKRPAVDFCLKATVVVLSAALVGVIAFAIREPPVTGVGDTAPDFEVMTRRGLRMTRQSFGGAVLVLNFWASWCAPCFEEIPSLVAFQAALQGSGVVVLGISLDQDENAYRTFLERFRVDFETARDPARVVSTRYGTVRIPETYIIDHSGVVAAKVISNRDWMDPGIVRFVKSLVR
jgi:cytochrome c biogenesis protein CcmG/thiol:disulfide interchange protein DsbE